MSSPGPGTCSSTSTAPSAASSPATPHPSSPPNSATCSPATTPAPPPCSPNSRTPTTPCRSSAPPPPPPPPTPRPPPPRHNAGAAALLAELEDAHDPMRVLRVAGDLGDDTLTRTIADALRDAEVKAAQTAEPTPHVDDVIRAALDTGRRLAVVSNNSTEAVTAYLRRMGLLTSFGRVVARYDGMAPSFMKPSNHLIGLALFSTDAPPWSTTLVGDTVPDITASRSIQIATIGYANKPGK